MARKKGAGGSKPKKVNLELVEEGSAAYRVLKAVRREFHKETERATVLLMWHKNMRADVDGHMVLGRCVKASEMQQQLGVDADFVIVLNHQVWNDKEFDLARQRALLDHEMCHVEKVLAADGSQKKDENGRLLWRLRHHDIEEFTGIVERHGMWKKDLERFGQALMQKANAAASPGLFEKAEAPAVPAVQ